ncbi:MAG: cytochrome-c peroxidase [Sphingobacteriaceae bacterium]|nr:cytochrome-c peroxidase [Sphingobacteriaceae bacterium]
MKHRILLLLLFVFAVGAISSIDLDNLYPYSSQTVPAYITKNNTPANNAINNRGATLGRVLFYDKQLSLNGQIACASCHLQAYAFSDTAVRSRGFDNGLTSRHSMRLVNARFGTSPRFFWDERALTLEAQTTQPIQDHLEMGFSGTNGQPGIDSLLRRLASLPRYQTLFPFVFGDGQITETRLQQTLAQFVRSIQSFDSKYDIGRAQVNNDAAPFPNFTADENAGKALFLAPPPAGGAGCQGCHRAPEFDIDPNSQNNGIIGRAGGAAGVELNNTRAPSLRNLTNTSGQLNGPLMHTGQFSNLEQVINHYNLVPQQAGNSNLDPRLAGPGGNLQLTPTQRIQLVAFLRTLSGTDVYTNPRWSDPFDANGNLSMVGGPTSLVPATKLRMRVYPNPAKSEVKLHLTSGTYLVKAHDLQGKLLLSERYEAGETLFLPGFASGMLLLTAVHEKTGAEYVTRLIVQP